MVTAWGFYPAKASSKKTIKANSGFKPNQEKAPPSTSLSRPSSGARPVAYWSIPLLAIQIHSSFWIDCNKTHYSKKLNDTSFAIRAPTYRPRPRGRLEAGVFGGARERDYIANIFHTRNELN